MILPYPDEQPFEYEQDEQGIIQIPYEAIPFEAFPITEPRAASHPFVIDGVVCQLFYDAVGYDQQLVLYDLYYPGYEQWLYYMQGYEQQPGRLVNQQYFHSPPIGIPAPSSDKWIITPIFGDIWGHVHPYLSNQIEKVMLVSGNDWQTVTNPYIPGNSIDVYLWPYSQYHPEIHSKFYSHLPAIHSLYFCAWIHKRFASVLPMAVITLLGLISLSSFAPALPSGRRRRRKKSTIWSSSRINSI